MSTVTWVQMGERQYATLDGTGQPFARISPKNGLWQVRFRYGPKNGHGVTVRGVGLLKRMVTRWAEKNADRLIARVPARATPYNPPSDVEKYFFDAIWPGYVPASRLTRYS
jgi:hypothetical protein